MRSQPTPEDEAWFWDSVEEIAPLTNRTKAREYAQEKWNQAEMQALARIHRFYFDKLDNEAFCQATPIVVEPDTDDSSALFNWVIAQGREFYNSVLNDPSMIPAEQTDGGMSLFGVLQAAHFRSYGDFIGED